MILCNKSPKLGSSTELSRVLGSVAKGGHDASKLRASPHIRVQSEDSAVGLDDVSDDTEPKSGFPATTTFPKHSGEKKPLMTGAVKRKTGCVL